jgi:hypothetical protein
MYKKTCNLSTNSSKTPADKRQTEKRGYRVLVRSKGRQKMGREEEPDLFITAKMPAWARTILANVGIDPEFKMSELTKEQREEIEKVNAFISLWNNGLVNVFYDPKTGNTPEFSLTEKGVKAAKNVKG